MHTASSHARPIFLLDEPEVERNACNIPRWSLSVPSSGDDEDCSPNSTPRLGSSWSPLVPSSNEALSPAEIALAAFEASRSRRKRSLTIESTSTSSSSCSGGEYDGYLTPDTSVASISPCSSPIEIDLESYEWPAGSGNASAAELDRCETASTDSGASSDTYVATPGTLARSASSHPALLRSRPMLVRSLTAPDSGCGMVRSISTPVATQIAHDALLRDMLAGMDKLDTEREAPRRALDDSMAELRVQEAAVPASLPWPYNLAKTTPDSQLRRPSLTRAVTFDASLSASVRL